MYKTSRVGGETVIVDDNERQLATVSMEGHARFGGDGGAELLVSHLNQPMINGLHAYRVQQTGAAVFSQQRRDMSSEAPVSILDPVGVVIADVTSAADAYQLVKILNEGRSA